MESSSQDDRGKRTLNENIKHFCLSDKYADVIFVFDENTEILHAHKNILSMRSIVFDAMFYGTLAESEHHVSKIKIEDMDAETFRKLLRFIYTDTIDLDGESVLKVMYLANKYSLTLIEDRCAGFLKTSIDVDNVCTIHEHAALYGKTELQNRCFEFIIEHGEDVLQSDNFLTIAKKTLHTIVSQDNLVTDEKLIFDSVVRWSRYQCTKSQLEDSAQNIRAQLGDIFFCIRFPLIPMETFAKEICCRQLFTTEEENQILKRMATFKGSTFSDEGSIGKISSMIRKEKYFTFRLPNRTQKVAYKRKQAVSLTVKPVNSVKLHAILFREQSAVANIEFIKLGKQQNGSSDDESESIDFKASYNKVELKQPMVINRATCLVFKFSKPVNNLNEITYIGTTGCNAYITYNPDIFDKIIFLR